MTLAEAAAHARRVRELYAAQATARGQSPWTAAELAQGFVGDVGDLMKLAMAHAGRRQTKTRDLEAGLAHELADCLWSVLVLAEAYHIDLGQAFAAAMADLERKLTAPRRTKTAQTPRARRG